MARGLEKISAINAEGTVGFRLVSAGERMLTTMVRAGFDAEGNCTRFA